MCNSWLLVWSVSLYINTSEEKNRADVNSRCAFPFDSVGSTGIPHSVCSIPPRNHKPLGYFLPTKKKRRKREWCCKARKYAQSWVCCKNIYFLLFFTMTFLFLCSLKFKQHWVKTRTHIPARGWSQMLRHSFAFCLNASLSLKFKSEG